MLREQIFIIRVPYTSNDTANISSCEFYILSKYFIKSKLFTLHVADINNLLIFSDILVFCLLLPK